MQTKSNVKKILIFTDIHGHYENFEYIKNELVSADLIVICGDLTNFGNIREAKEGIDSIKKHNKSIISIAGNCDYDTVSEYLTNEGINISEKPFNFYGIKFVGISGSLETPTKCTPSEHPDEYYQENLPMKINKGETKFIIVSHQPPFGTINDKVESGIHVGSKALRDFIEKTQPIFCLSGHIHEGIGVDIIGRTKIVNPGPMKDGLYGLIELDVENLTGSIELKSIR